MHFGVFSNLLYGGPGTDVCIWDFDTLVDCDERQPRLAAPRAALLPSARVPPPSSRDLMHLHHDATTLSGHPVQRGISHDVHGRVVTGDMGVGSLTALEEVHAMLFSHLAALLHREEDGATMVEYGLMVALIAVVALVAVTALGGSVRDIFSSVAGVLTP